MRVTVAVARGQLAEHPVKLVPVGPRAGRLLAIDVPAREKALGDEAVVGFDHGDPRDIVVGGEDAGGGDASSTLEPADQHGVA